MESCFRDNPTIVAFANGLQLSRLRFCYARSALFIDPMLLTTAARAGAAIAIAIPIEAGDAGRWGVTPIR